MNNQMTESCNNEQITNSETIPDSLQDLLDIPENERKPTNNYSIGEWYEKTGKYQEAVIFYTKAADEGNLNAQIKLAEAYYLSRYGLDKNYEKSFNYFLKAAKIGKSLRDPYACYKLGVYLCQGIGVEKNVRNGLKHIYHSAKYGYYKAEFLIYCLLNKEKCHLIQELNIPSKYKREAIRNIKISKDELDNYLLDAVSKHYPPAVLKYYDLHKDNLVEDDDFFDNMIKCSNLNQKSEKVENDSESLSALSEICYIIGMKYYEKVEAKTITFGKSHSVDFYQAENYFKTSKLYGNNKADKQLISLREQQNNDEVTNNV